MEKILIDVRTREEFVQEHIKGALNIPHYDLEFHTGFLRGKEVVLYCNTGRRSLVAQKKLAAMNVPAQVLSLEEQETLEKEGRPMVCALNYVVLKQEKEEEFMARAMDLCRLTEELDGFLGSKVLRFSGISPRGSFIPGDTMEMEAEPLQYLLLTFWESKEAHETSHAHPAFEAVFRDLPEFLAKMPYEEFYEVVK